MSVFRRNNKWLLLSSMTILLAVCFYIYYLYASWRTLGTVTLPTPDCEVSHGPCVSTLPNGDAIELRIKNTHMPVLTSVQLEVKTKIPGTKKIYVNFKGAEMNMGEFQYDLLPQKSGIFSAQTILPTCISDQMVWHAIVNVETSNKKYVAPFILVNQKPQT
ncbi:MAG: hypothetical protein ACHQJ6_05955 [Candidatus Berkiellales bacterium]